MEAIDLVSTEVLPPIVYHYTTTAGLLGIIGGGLLPAIDLRYLNDLSELRYGLTQTLRALERVAQLPHRQSVVDHLARVFRIADGNDLGPLAPAEVPKVPKERFESAAAAIIDSLGAGTTIGVACFCSSGDVLSQWRGYGVGGYAIGFDAKTLRQRVADWYLPLTPVVYGRRAGRALLRNIANRVRSLLTTTTSLPFATLRDTLTLPLRGLAAQIKDPSFASEAELRLGHYAHPEDTKSARFRRRTVGCHPVRTDESAGHNWAHAVERGLPGAGSGRSTSVDGRYRATRQRWLQTGWARCRKSV